MHCPPLAPAARSYVFPFAVQADGDQRVVIKESGLTLRVPDVPCAARTPQQPRGSPGLMCRLLRSGSLSLPVRPSPLCVTSEIPVLTRAKAACVLTSFKNNLKAAF